MTYRGFQTSRGDFYAATAAGDIVHFENTSQPQSLDDESLCLFVAPHAIKDLDSFLADTKHFELKWTDAGKIEIINRATGKISASDIASKTISIGSLPIQKKHGEPEDGRFLVGYPVTEIYRTHEELRRAAPPQLMEMIEQHVRRHLSNVIALKPDLGFRI